MSWPSTGCTVARGGWTRTLQPADERAPDQLEHDESGERVPRQTDKGRRPRGRGGRLPRSQHQTVAPDAARPEPLDDARGEVPLADRAARREHRACRSRRAPHGMLPRARPRRRARSRTAGDAVGLLDERREPGAMASRTCPARSSGVSGATTSSPVEMIATRGRAHAAISPMPAAESAASWRGPIGWPASTSIAPTAKSSSLPITCWPRRAAREIRTVPLCRSRPARP